MKKDKPKGKAAPMPKMSSKMHEAMESKGGGGGGKKGCK